MYVTASCVCWDYFSHVGQCNVIVTFYDSLEDRVAICITGIVCLHSCEVEQVSSEGSGGGGGFDQQVQYMYTHHVHVLVHVHVLYTYDNL